MPTTALADPDIRIGSRVRVRLAVNCGDDRPLDEGTVDFVFPGRHAFTVRFEGLRTEVVARYEIKEVLGP